MKINITVCIPQRNILFHRVLVFFSIYPTLRVALNHGTSVEMSQILPLFNILLSPSKFEGGNISENLLHLKLLMKRILYLQENIYFIKLYPIIMKSNLQCEYHNS